MKQARRIAFVRNAPLPARDGVAPSRVYLPDGPWSLLRDFLLDRFPHVPREALLERLARGDIVNESGDAQTLDSPYQALGWLWYYREVPDEVHVPFDVPVLFRDDYLVVADKPHFLASIPGGRYLRETALVRLRDALNLPELSPIHRLDRDTAGILLFCAKPESRGAYQALFQSRDVRKEYEAIAPLYADLRLPRVHRSCLAARAGHFTMREVPGEPNSETEIELLERLGEWGRYRLCPHTGRKHQLRVHMSALGIPIRHDDFYPELQPYAQAHDFSRPLQLLARSIEFVDPVSGQQRRFESQRSLDRVV
ncbi:pseudouridine synthase [Pollutimonas harenae]|uniref:Pseudouridine synthase n=1 Tax=Pollutimonas harenae TaxID=657015 RepID=A0A853GPC1_9BURK|nr:pseudouridine synthase [Pollutimonas harenae]NYT84888.1 pseudouridine synthase [Pollutimonas harenae]TEA72714.1 pseudouridine synthase [Pollutimonas harenae]